MTNVHSFTAQDIDGNEKHLSDFQGKALLVVNVASKCGLTPQYGPLEAIYKKYQAQGLEILGFPCNQFMGQEPGTNADIKGFCETQFGVTFPMFSRIEVNGDAAHPLYKYLETQSNGPAPAGDITWNFEKFVVGRDGNVIARFSPKTAPDAPEVLKALETAIG